MICQQRPTINSSETINFISIYVGLSSVVDDNSQTKLSQK